MHLHQQTTHNYYPQTIMIRVDDLIEAHSCVSWIKMKFNERYCSFTHGGGESRTFRPGGLTEFHNSVSSWQGLPGRNVLLSPPLCVKLQCCSLNFMLIRVDGCHDNRDLYLAILSLFHCLNGVQLYIWSYGWAMANKRLHTKSLPYCRGGSCDCHMIVRRDNCMSTRVIQECHSFKSRFTLHTAISHTITVLERQVLTCQAPSKYTWDSTVYMLPLCTCYHCDLVSDSRVQCALGTNNPEMTSSVDVLFSLHLFVALFIALSWQIHLSVNNYKLYSSCTLSPNTTPSLFNR